MKSRNDIVNVLALLYFFSAKVLSEDIPAIDSDYMFLESKKSTLPFPSIGVGVFAKMDIPAEEILCEYRGPMVESSVNYISDKSFTTSVSGKSYRIVGENLCAYINDCVWIIRNYTKAEIDSMKNSQDYSLPLIPGFSYNAKAYTTKMGKVFIVSSVNIPAGAEIFFPYTISYWDKVITESINGGVLKIID